MKEKTQFLSHITLFDFDLILTSVSITKSDSFQEINNYSYANYINLPMHYKEKVQIKEYADKNL